MSLRIGQYIKFALGRDNAQVLDSLISGRLSPVRMPDNPDTDVPWICYRSEGLEEQDTKDGSLCDTNTVTMDVVCRSYEELLELLSLVREAMSRAVYTWNCRDGISFRIEEQTFRAGLEDYDEVLQAYVRPLNFTITTENHV